jgi:hypothetical protein
MRVFRNTPVLAFAAVILVVLHVLPAECATSNERMAERALEMNRAISRSMIGVRVNLNLSKSTHRKINFEKQQRKLVKIFKDLSDSKISDSRRHQAARWDIGFGKRSVDSTMPAFLSKK